MDILSKMGAFLDGKKTYIVSLITGALGLYIATGTATAPHIVPEWLWVILGAAGLGAIRSSIGNQPKS